MDDAFDDPKKGRLLILDDDQDVATTLGRSAQRMGLETRNVSDAMSFLHQLDTWAPTHIAVDLVMPGMDGVQILRLLAQRQCAAMIIITSGVGPRVLDAAQRSAEEQSLNIAGVLPKPFDLAILRELLSKRPPAPVAPATAAQGPADASEVTEVELRGAIDRRELELAYQPKIDCADGRVVGFEALVRWRRSTGELVMPDRFIGVAERSGLIDALTDQVCDMAVRWLKASSLSQGQTMSINISARNLIDIDLADRLAKLCADVGLDPSRLILELTESTALENRESSLVLASLRVKGFHLSIDDFGTGYASMAQLIRLPFSELKIDKSLVDGAVRSEESRTVIASIVDLGHRLGLTLTAEGVEDAQTLQLLRDLKCDLAQGYHIARPMPGDQVAAWLAERVP
jgi:EAL domain-containing protein (putative c-di-GMP-specific phosphodiesterase class I)/ActR/RegA family two-component response regulator